MQIFLIYFNRFVLGLSGFVGFRFFVQCNLHHYLVLDFGNLAVERTHARLAGVVTDNIAHRAFFDCHFLFFYAVALHLLRHEVLYRDIDFFVYGVAGHTDDFHTVEQLGRDIQAV